MASSVIQDAHAFWAGEAQGTARAVFAAEGIRCANCSRSIERAVSALPGIERVSVNAATSRVSVDWDSARVDLKRILQTVADAGFKPMPLAGKAADAALRIERRTALKRIGLAGLGMMQVMMYVFGVYVARPDSIDPAIASYLRYVGMVITTPVLVYSGWPFFAGAWQNIRQRALGMDVPVALALALAYAASVFNTVRGSGQTYFDSVTMFIFFLSAGRYVEMIVRQRSLSMSEAVSRSLPAQATRVKENGITERIPIAQIAVGDVLSVPKGAVIPVDAELARVPAGGMISAAEAVPASGAVSASRSAPASGPVSAAPSALGVSTALIDESLITGESAPERKEAGALLLGGSVNVGSPIRVIARNTVTGSALASIVALLERVQGERPAIARSADRVAGVFVLGILVLAALVALVWYFIDPSRAFPASLAVLVVTCPCALSLATPAAVAAATTRLARTGLLVTRADALERLATVDTVVLDKTGTLTSGTPCITGVTLLADTRPTTSDRWDERSVLAIAAALESASTHPIAAAFARHAELVCAAENLAEIEGRGVAGTIVGEPWRLGRLDFVAELAPPGGGAQTTSRSRRPGDDGRVDDALYLGNAFGLVAAFELGEDVRPESRVAIEKLRALGVEPVIASGDHANAVDRVARQLNIAQAHARLSPNEKVALVQGMQAGGRHALAVGDGINDGPVLAAASVSCAMGQGSAIAQAAADLLLLSDSLTAIANSIDTARRMLTVIKQNLRWSLIYNFAAVPLAAMDLVPPWVAAIGMSVSSLVVVLNARRLASGSTSR